MKTDVFCTKTVPLNFRQSYVNLQLIFTNGFWFQAHGQDFPDSCGSYERSWIDKVFKMNN